MTGGTSLDALAFRPATVADAGALAALMTEAVGTYRSFAPPGWEPLRADAIEENLTARLGRPTVWCLLAEERSRVAGYVSLLPAADARRPVADPRLAHFWMLFVRAPWWGTGLAQRLHGDAVAEATERGFTAMRLFTPAEQARARRFYEREGWSAAAEPFPDDDIGLRMIEYRRTLPTRGPDRERP
jgi:GNAT superfamily N-acetyltransferase